MDLELNMHGTIKEQRNVFKFKVENHYEFNRSDRKLSMEHVSGMY